MFVATGLKDVNIGTDGAHGGGRGWAGGGGVRYARGGSALPLILAGVVALAVLIAAGFLILRGVSNEEGNSAAGSGVAALAAEAAQKAKLEQGAEALRAMRYAEARAVLEPLADERPFDSDLRVLLAEALLGLEEFGEAYKQYEAAIALEQQGGGAAGVSPDLHFTAGTVASRAGFLERANEHYAMARASRPTDARFAMFHAMVQIRMNEKDAANASLLQAVHLDPDLGEAWGTMAELEYGANRLGVSQQHLDRAMALQPGVERWRVLQARIFNRQARAEEAATIILGLSEPTRRTKSVLRLLGESYGLLSRPADAAKAYEEAATRERTDAELWYEAAVWRERAGDLESALRHARTASMLGHAEAGSLVNVLTEPGPQ